MSDGSLRRYRAASCHCGTDIADRQAAVIDYVTMEHACFAGYDAADTTRIAQQLVLDARPREDFVWHPIEQEQRSVVAS